MKIPCKLPLEFCKRQFLRERGIEQIEIGSSWHFKCPDELRNGREQIRAIFMQGASDMKEEVMACQNETQIGNVMEKWGRISLHEWIESL